mmetsp:Transcript_15677/g.36636  ORF Transcript_15677/g.36636 Transcript_15677/m.36636 type:complete len:365 (-) Transcript_15677:1461-2555(-)
MHFGAAECPATLANFTRPHSCLTRSHVVHKEIHASALEGLRRLCAGPQQPTIANRACLILGRLQRGHVALEALRADLLTRSDVGRRHGEPFDVELLLVAHPHALLGVAALAFVVHTQKPVLTQDVWDHLLHKAVCLLVVCPRKHTLHRLLQGLQSFERDNVAAAPTETKLDDASELLKGCGSLPPNHLPEVVEMFQCSEACPLWVAPEVSDVHTGGGRHLVGAVQAHLWHPQLAREKPVGVRCVWPTSAELGALHALGQCKELPLANGAIAGLAVHGWPKEIPGNDIAALHLRSQLHWIEPLEILAVPDERGEDLILPGCALVQGARALQQVNVVTVVVDVKVGPLYADPVVVRPNVHYRQQGL